MERLENNLYGKIKPGQKYCLNCGSTFVAIRSTRKYCSDSCKQLHFYKRSGLQLSGSESNQAFNVKTVREDIAFSVKDSVKRETGSDRQYFTLNDTSIELIIERLQEALEDRIQQAVDRALEKIADQQVNPSLSFNDKDAINVKQYNRSLKYNDKPSLHEPEEEEDPEYQIQLLEPSDNESMPDLMNQDTKESEETKQEEKVNDPITKKAYEYIHPTFLENIRSYEDSSETLFKFSRPQNYWNAEAIIHVKWVSLRFSTLMGTLLHLSAKPFIDKGAIRAVSDAFKWLCASKHFIYLPGNYPHTQLIRELREKMRVISQDHMESEGIRFRLSPERRAQLIATRWQMGDFVPRMKFSQVNFME